MPASTADTDSDSYDGSTGFPLPYNVRLVRVELCRIAATGTLLLETNSDHGTYSEQDEEDDEDDSAVMYNGISRHTGCGRKV